VRVVDCRRVRHSGRSGERAACGWTGRACGGTWCR
jgi:hypothetical protein